MDKVSETEKVQQDSAKKLDAEKESEESNQDENKKKDSNQRSRSREKKRFRSKEQKKKKKKNKHKDRRRSRSVSESVSRHRSRSRDRKKSKDRKKHVDRGRSRERKHRKNRHEYKPEYRPTEGMPAEIPMPHIPTEVPMPEMPGERRRRQRSRSPLDYYRKNQNNNDGQFWDSFSWVPRINYTPNVSTSALANTKKMRRLMITNIPYQIGITEDNLRDLITRFMSLNYLKDQMNNCPVVNLQINQTDHNVAVELSSVEETCRMCRMEKIQLFKEVHNGIVRLGDSIYGNSVLTQAQTAGQAQAAAFAAINVIENKKTNFTIDSTTKEASSTVIRVTNAVTSYMATHLTQEQWQDYHEDLIEGFSQYGTIVHDWLVKDSEKDICADGGNMFIEYEYKENAEAAMSEMQGRIYDERTIQLYFIPREMYYKNFRANIVPPTLPPPLKTTKK